MILNKQILLFCIVILFSCHSFKSEKKIARKDAVFTKSNDYFPDEKTDSIILDTLFKFPFVRESAHYIDLGSHHKYEMSFDMDTSLGNIYVRLGYRVNRGSHFDTYYSFIVDTTIKHIKILSPGSDSILSIDDYTRNYPQAIKGKILN